MAGTVGVELAVGVVDAAALALVAGSDEVQPEAKAVSSSATVAGIVDLIRVDR